VKKWIVYVFVLAFAAYWASNLLLWFPWSYSSILGMVLMLTVAPLIWAYITYLGLITFPRSNLFKAALTIALSLLTLSVVMDYVFFGLIRNAMEELYHPTTFYGYGFLLVWPFILVAILKIKIVTNKKGVSRTDVIKTLALGLAFFSILAAIILFDIKI